MILVNSARILCYNQTNGSNPGKFYLLPCVHFGPNPVYQTFTCTGKDRQTSESGAIPPASVAFTSEVWSCTVVDKLSRVQCYPGVTECGSFCRRNIITIAVFYALPVMQLVITYQTVSAAQAPASFPREGRHSGFQGAV